MNSIESFAPGKAYYLNPATHKMELTDKTVDYDAILKAAQEQFEELKKNPVGKNTLTDAEINELAQKYDPRKMTQKEYDTLIRYLEQKGVLSKLETCDIGMSFTRIIPGYNGLTESMGTEAAQWIGDLADANGNALRFAQAGSQLPVSGYNGEIRQGAYSKVLDILNQMDAARGESAGSQLSPAFEENGFGFADSIGIWASNRTVSAPIGDLYSFQWAIDRVKNERIQTV